LNATCTTSRNNSRSGSGRAEDDAVETILNERFFPSPDVLAR
jgi:hypothetical protein